jgi:hypothetical protein
VSGTLASDCEGRTPSQAATPAHQTQFPRPVASRVGDVEPPARETRRPSLQIESLMIQSTYADFGTCSTYRPALARNRTG